MEDLEDRYRQIFENANDVIYTTDLDHNLTAINKAGRELVGYDGAEILGRNISLIVPSEYVQRLDQMKHQLMAGRSSTIFEIELLTVDGRRVPAEVSARIIYEDRTPVAIQGILRDVSERKRLEEQLWRSQRMEAIGQLAGGIAHDFSNILTIILGYTNLMADSAGAKHTADRNVEGIQNAVSRATALTRQLLAFSRRQILRPRVLWINNVITDLHALLRRLIGEDIELVMDLNSDVALVRADQSQIEQVIMNLVINARDAMPNGGKVTIATRNAELTDEDAREYPYVIPGPHVMLELSDTGEGMDEETLAHIFEPFFTTKESGKGTGLGLATAYGIVKQSGGYIWAFSEPRQGASFRIFLPRALDVSFDDESLPFNLQPVQNGTEVVLLVEDEDELRILLRNNLEKKGYTVLEATDGLDALHVVREYTGPIHVAVTDLVMPKMGGRALGDHLATLRPDTQVLFISGYANDAAIRRDGLRSAVHFLQKPFEPVILADKIRQVLDHRVAK